MYKKNNILFLTLSLFLYLNSCTPIQQTQRTIITPQNWPVITKNESDFRKYFDDNLNILEPIEGIWSMQEGGTWRNVLSGIHGNLPENKSYRIAIIKDSKKVNYDFTAIILESSYKWWKPGLVKAYFRKTSYDNIYEGLWYMGDFSSTKGNFIFEKNGLIKWTETRYLHPIEKNIETIFIKAYPLNNKMKFSSSNNELKSSGSGFLLSANGLIVTNFHVVENANKIEIVFPEKELTKTATIKIKDSNNDIAILEIDNFSFPSNFNKDIPYNIGNINNIKVGEEVFTLGFPLGQIMGNKSRLSVGRINSFYGLKDDPRLFQISNPLQPGNSGGPLFNNNGELIGIVVSSLNAKYFYDNIGIIPQNVNFAIKATYLKNLISMIPEGDDILKRKNVIKQGKMEELIEQLNSFVVKIKVY